jgi:hypothetical protein
MKSCCIAIDTPVTENMSDAQTGDLCCAQCNFWFWPIVAVFDIVSLPYRGPKHLIKKCKKSSKKTDKRKK